VAGVERSEPPDAVNSGGIATPRPQPPAVEITMDSQPSSRQLSERVEVGFHRRPNRMRRRMWFSSVAACLVALVWLAVVSVEGDYKIYEAGDVATAHKSFENDCAQCHTSWAPLERLVQFDSNVHSVSNEKCIHCHDGLSHYRNSDGSFVTHNSAMSCAACHREHQGDEGLAVVADRHCVTCHSDLNNEKQFTGTVAARIESFDPHASTFAHPEFALLRVLNGDPGQDVPGIKHAVHALLSGEGKPKDQAAIRFNHKRHLHAVYENGVLAEGLLDENRRLIDLSNRCDRCHELDAERRTMKPVNYEQNCSSCHPLYYDQRGNANRVSGSGTGKLVVPHESPEIVRGFLTNLFTNQVSQANAALDKQPQPQIPPFPGRPRMTQSQEQEVQRLVKDVETQLLREPEKAVRDNDHKFFGLEAAGGCKYCHAISITGNDPIPNWSIVPPNIPQQWMPYSQFSHFPHRNVNCQKCHNDVYKSDKTSDVIMTSIQTCRECHTTEISGTPAGPGARTQCVTCHDFHQHHSKEWTALPRASKGTEKTH
jgi:hypothetical protein